MEYFVRLPKMFVQLENRGYIAASIRRSHHVSLLLDNGGQSLSPIAIVGSTPHSHDRLIEHKLVSLHSQLMSSCDKVDSIMVCEYFRDISAKEEARAARG